MSESTAQLRVTRREGWRLTRRLLGTLVIGVPSSPAGSAV